MRYNSDLGVHRGVKILFGATNPCLPLICYDNMYYTDVISLRFNPNAIRINY